MPYVSPEVIEQARQIDLLTYLQAFEPSELVKISPNNYTTRTHDSLKISNGKWMWWSQRIGGYNALDYLVKVKGCSFVEAVETLMGKAAVMPSIAIPKPKKEVSKVLLLPDKSASTDRITEYLFSRGIDFSIIDYCISHDLIFESLPYHNIVFVGYDRENKPKYAAYRATNDRRLMGDCSGSDKHYSFRIADSKSDELHLFECAIDLLSYATVERMEGRDWREYNLVSLVEPGKYPRMIEIEDSLEAMQRVVGGDIEEFMPYEDDIAIICNEEGKMNGMSPNRAIYSEPEEVEMTYGELTGRFRQAEREGRHISGYIVFTQDSFTEAYSEEQRTYAVSSNNKAFIEGMGGYSIYASSLDGSDPCVRLEAYMADEHGGKDGWKIERCYMKDPESREMVDIIFGQFFVCYAPAESEKFLSLPKELAQKYEARFKFPERFFKQGNEIKAVPYKPKTRGQER